MHFHHNILDAKKIHSTRQNQISIQLISDFFYFKFYIRIEQERLAVTLILNVYWWSIEKERLVTRRVCRLSSLLSRTTLLVSNNHSG